ncbi:hypothetical protein [Paludisphaera mucosa]|uniref:OstA-like protein n=1 Tax=Paludisphaera mucosa TaxID=3030827 RepID=A0ABT6FIJ0_9BACT|nr:hypothetical protein [Paludisphaera mucosa]MDG3007395.1 hypothetical protein [Paludisphaera mucosa]
MSSRFVLKKLSKLAMVFGLLTAAHLAYVRAFDRAVAGLRSARGGGELAFQVHDSKSKTMVKRVAAQVFGPDHWTNSDDLLRYVAPDKGVILFAMNFSRPTERDGVRFDGKRIEVDPAAVVLRSPKGGSTRTMTSKNAVIDFNQPFGLNVKADAEPLTVKRARLERDVMIRDDRGTPDDPSDDLVAGPLTNVEYVDDGVNPVIRTDSDVVLVDRNLRVTGTGMEIQLRPKIHGASKGSGFDGAQRLTLFKNIRVTFLDVGSTGMMPDLDAQPASGATAKARTKAGAKPRPKDPADAIPLDVQCAGPLIVELPRSPAAPSVGPPEPAAPTYVEFRSNVVVRRGKLTELPDQIDCDTLHLTLLPDEKKKPVVVAEAEAGAATAAEGGEPQEAQAKGGAFGGLTLRRLKASGHVVWVQSPTKGVKIRCVELLHYKDPAAGKNTTVFNGGGLKKLWFEKRDVAAAGVEPAASQSVTHVWCTDATLTDDGDMGRAALVANGPGLLETRPSPGAAAPPHDVPPARTAVWRDQLWLQNEIAEDGRTPGKVLVLKGSPRVEDRNQKSSLEAADRIVVWLNPTEKAPALTADGREVVPTAFFQPDPAAAAAPKEALPSIRRLLAVQDVHLVDPTRDLRLRERLDVDFEAGTVAASPPITNPNPVAKQADPAPTPEPAPAANGEAVPDLTPVPGQAAAEKPAGPKMTARADRAQAVVIVGAKSAARAGAATPAKTGEEPAYELRDVEMRGDVQLHQDPGEGKKVGTDATGEVLVLRTEAKGQVVFDLYHHDQHSAKGRMVDARKAPKARVTTDTMTIEADTIGVDQKADQAWAYGEGKLIQLTDRGLFTDRPADAPKDGEAPEAAVVKIRKRGGKTLSEKVPIVITWKKMMTFEGVSQDPLKRPAAKIKFIGGAHAQMEDALLHGEESLTAYTDKPIPLVDAGKFSTPAKPKDPNAEAGAEEPEPRADLSMLEVRGTKEIAALAVSRKVHPDRPVLLSQQRLEAGMLIYDRRTGTFKAPGPGEVFLYDRNADPTKAQNPDADAAVAAGPVVRPTAFDPGQDEPGGSKPKLAANPDAPRRAGAAGAKPALAPLVLTQIKFVREMRGRFGSGKQDDVDEQRWAEFFGAVETARGTVANEAVRFDFDRLPPEAYFMTSEMLRVINEPPPPGAAKTANGRNFLKAWDNAYVKARDTALQADVITYDSLNDLVFANGLNGQPVQIVRQNAPGQTMSPGRAQAVRFNPKSGAADLVGPEVWALVDNETGVRPGIVKPYDPNPKAGPKPKKPPVRMQTNPAERKGFTGR